MAALGASCSVITSSARRGIPGDSHSEVSSPSSFASSQSHLLSFPSKRLTPAKKQKVGSLFSGSIAQINAEQEKDSKLLRPISNISKGSNSSKLLGFVPHVGGVQEKHSKVLGSPRETSKILGFLPEINGAPAKDSKILGLSWNASKLLSFRLEALKFLGFLPPGMNSGEILSTLVLFSLPTIAGFNLEGPQSVIEALSVLASIIAVHESGHFFAAYFQRIHISRFSIGFGPTLLKLQGKKVEYSLRAIPLGGFVGFPDENDPESEYAPDDPDLLKNRPILDRLLVTSAGVIANLVFAYVILFGQVSTSGLLQRELMDGVLVPEVMSSSAAEKSGVHGGDVILSVDGQTLKMGENSVYDLVRKIKESPNHPLSFTISRKMKNESQQVVQIIEVVPDSAIDGSGKIGVQLAPNSKTVKVKAKDIVDASAKASKEFSRLFGSVVDGLKQVFFNFSKTVDKISGPVAIVAVGAEVARTDSAGLSQFAAIVNINLAVVNILPLPALDGGYIFLIGLEAIRGGKKLPDKVEQGIMSSGLLLLIGLGTFLIVRDAFNLGIAELL